MWGGRGSEGLVEVRRWGGVGWKGVGFVIRGGGGCGCVDVERVDDVGSVGLFV